MHTLGGGAGCAKGNCLLVPNSDNAICRYANIVWVKVRSQITGLKASASDGHCSNCCLDSVVKISSVEGMKTKKEL